MNLHTLTQRCTFDLERPSKMFNDTKCHADSLQQLNLLRYGIDRIAIRKPASQTEGHNELNPSLRLNSRYKNP